MVCCRYGKMEKHKILSRETEEGNHLEDVGITRRIILK
jgi:hypothetical protein